MSVQHRTDAFNVMMKAAEALDVKTIITKHVQKGLSHQTKKLLGDNGAVGAAAITDGTMGADDAMILSVGSLLEFGASEFVPAADEMAQAFLLKNSR